MRMVLLALALHMAVGAEAGYDTALSEPQEPSAAITPVRSLRKNTILLQLGLNTLVGAGVQYSRAITPFLNLDTGFGMSFLAIKTGLRLRAHFLASDFTPFVGAGAMYMSGTPKAQYTSDPGNMIAYRVLPSAFVQGTAGLTWTTRSGFSMLADVGWAQLLGGTNVEIKAGTPTDNQMERLSFSAGSGPTCELAMGYSF